jgi:thioredoxin-like negative regulator of GroEL
LQYKPTLQAGLVHDEKPAENKQVTESKHVQDDDETIIYELTDEDVPNIIQKERHVIIMVFAPWCKFCAKMAPEFAKAAQKLQKHCTWARLNADQFPQAAKALGVDSFPTTLQFKDGKLVKPMPGAMDAEKLIVQVQ